MAGGHGSRLNSVSGRLPKALVPVAGVPILEYQIEQCKAYEFDNIVLLLGHEANKIIEHFGNGSDFGVKIEYSVEPRTMGTGGAIKSALNLLSDDFILLYGDTYFDIDLSSLFNAHMNKKAQLTVVAHPSNHPNDSDLIFVDYSTNIIKKISTYPHRSEALPNMACAAMCVINKQAYQDQSSGIDEPFDLSKTLLPRMISANKKIFAYITCEYIHDMGTPDRLDKVNKDIKFNIPELLSSRNKRQAVFIDRDGTLIEDVQYLSSQKEVKLVSGASAGIKRLNESGYLTVMVTNQPVIARGDLTIDGLNAIHNYLNYSLGCSGAYLDAMYYCPHHPDKGYKGEVEQLKIHCNCRKPNTGMLKKAIKSMNIDPKRSWMVGDTTTDIAFGNNGGLRTILVETGGAGKDGKYSVVPDYIFPTLNLATDWITQGYQKRKKLLLELFPQFIGGQKIYLIGGLSRSSKTTTANVLADIFREQGETAHILSLDAWLIDPKERKNCSNVLEKYDVESFLKLFKKIIRNSDELHELPIHSHGQKKLSIKRKFHKDDKLIIEGIPVFLDQRLRSLSEDSIYCDINEDLRLKRFVEFYKMRKYSDKSIKELFLLRGAEVKAVQESKRFAKYIIWDQNDC